MTTAFIGDIHGNAEALITTLGILRRESVTHAVFLGDYVNKSTGSFEVMELLSRPSTSYRKTLLRGNHESAMLEALNAGELAAFLKMGGAQTIRSYVKGTVGPNVLNEFRAAVPATHLDCLKGMPESYSGEDFDAYHSLPHITPRFSIAGHQFIGLTPLITANYALLDTGCGTGSGRLTTMLWPTRTYFQVDESGGEIG